jgi:tetratricopeptide (TPR) repeat protein
MAYWRSGEPNEANTWVELSLSHKLPDYSDVRLYAHLTKSLIHLSQKKYDDIILNLTSLESYFLKYGDDFLKGSFSCNLGVALKNSDKTQEAIKYFEFAKFFHKKSGHRIYLGLVENNIAQTFKLEQKFSKAHQAIDNAIRIFKRINDRTRYGFSYDTKALIYLDEGKSLEALETINKAIFILENTENADYLVETYITKVKSLLLLDNFLEATRVVSKAINLAETKIGEDKVIKIIKEYENFLRHKNSPKFKNIYTEKELIDENIKLVLSPELSHFDEIEGVWIKNKHLEAVGLKKGSLAIIVNEEVKRGDLVAIAERESEAVSCGFYDIDFGIICLQGTDGEPQLFDESDIQILGKIVGVTDAQKDEEGKMFVEPIKIAEK